MQNAKTGAGKNRIPDSASDENGADSRSAEKQDREIDRRREDFFHELCVMQAVSWGAYFVARENYGALTDYAELALLHEFERVVNLYESCEELLLQDEGLQAT